MVRKIKRNNAAKIKKELAKAEKNLQNIKKTDISNIIDNQNKSFKPDKIVWGLAIFSIIIIALILFVNNTVQNNKQKNTPLTTPDQTKKIFDIDKSTDLKKILGKPKPIQEKENQEKLQDKKEINKKEVDNKNLKIIPEKKEDKK